MPPLPVLETARMVLLPAAPELAQRTADFYARNRELFLRYEPARLQGFFSVEGQRADLTREAADAQAGRGARFFLTLRDEPDDIVGCVALNGIRLGLVRSCLLGYKIDERMHGRGLGTEGVAAVTAFAFDTLRLHAVVAYVMPRNAPSLRVLEKCGYRRGELVRAYLNVAGTWEDHIRLVCHAPAR